MNNIKFVDLKKNYESIKEDITKEFFSLFENCDFIHGKKVEIFEENFAKYLGLNHFIGCANGTDALEIAIKCLNLKEEDEIIVQGNTYIATCLGVLNNKVKLVLCDIVEDTHMINLEKLEKKINEKTKAIIIVHLYGFMPNMDKVLQICEKNNLFLIEDCAQAHGASWNGKKAGTFGDISCFSFYPGKNLGGYGDGGGIGTNNNKYNEKMRKIANIGCKLKYQHELIGRNSRLDTLQASFLNVKLQHLDTWNEMRRTDASIYSRNLKSVGDIQLPVVIENCIPVYHLYVIRTKYRDELKEFLESKKIQCLIHYPISVAETDAMKHYNFDLNDLKQCIKNSKEMLSLPMFPELEIHEVNYICDSIKLFFLKKNLLKFETFKTNGKPGILSCINNFHFDTRRFFTISDFKEDDIGKKRGHHANLNFKELLIILDGSIKVKLINQDKIEEIKIVSKNETILIEPMKWIEYEILEVNTNIICLVDKEYSYSESIFNFEEFISFTYY